MSFRELAPVVLLIALVVIAAVLFVLAVASLPDILSEPSQPTRILNVGDSCSFDPHPPCKNWRP